MADHFSWGPLVNLSENPQLAVAVLGEKVAHALLAVTGREASVRLRVKSICRARREVTLEFDDEPPPLQAQPAKWETGHIAVPAGPKWRE